MIHKFGHQLLFLVFLKLKLVCLGQAQSYHYPVNPGQTTYLAGNVGEIRNNHFHAGLDIAVMTGTPVYAAADGYVYRARVSAYGYGKAIYLDHPQTEHRTVYAHLSRFNQAIRDYVVKQQYAQESFEVDLYPEPEAIPIRKGQVIGYTGNTGGSAGPHLHYEIRTFADVALNPMEFDFSEIQRDRLPPVISKIALNSLAIDARVGGRFARQEYSTQRVAPGRYTVSQIIPISGTIGFEMLSHDVANGAYNTYATTEMEVWLDGKKVYGHRVNEVPHEYNLSMNVHVNYEIYRKTYQGFQRCYVVDGNRFPHTYDATPERGFLRIKDTKVHQVLLKARDVWGNESVLSLRLQGQMPAKPIFRADLSPSPTRISHQIQGNVLLIAARHVKQHGDSISLYFNGICLPVPLAYMNGKEAVYLWDLQKGLPDFVEVDGQRHAFRLKMLIPSERDFHYREEGLHIFFPDSALFDTLFLETDLSNSRLQINDPFLPLYKPIEVHFQPKNLRFSAQAAMFYQGRSYLRSEWTDSTTLTFYTRSLGQFVVKADRQAPSIQLKNKSRQGIQFRIRDDFSGIADFRATLNGKYLLMDYEYKNGALISVPKNENDLLQGNFQLEVWDEVGNRQVYQTQL